MFRPTAAALLCALLAAACGPRAGRNPSALPTDRRGRTIVLTDSLLAAGGADTIRFGRLRSGETAEQRFWLLNATGRNIAVASYTRSCGCTTLEYDARPLAPGDAARLTLRFDTRGERGWQMKSIGLALAGIERPLRLLVEAEVE